MNFVDYPNICLSLLTLGIFLICVGIAEKQWREAKETRATWQRARTARWEWHHQSFAHTLYSAEGQWYLRAELGAFRLYELKKWWMGRTEKAHGERLADLMLEDCDIRVPAEIRFLRVSSNQRLDKA